MTGRPLAAALVIAGVLVACGGDASGPRMGDSGDPGIGEVTAKVSDPSGDVFGTGTVRWDMTALTITRDAAGITVVLEASEDLVSPTSGDPDAMIGFVEFDTDQDPATGIVSTVDEFRPDNGSTGIRVDYQLVLANYARDSTVTVFNSTGNPVGQVRPVFNGKAVTIRIPRATIGNDDGFLNAAAIVGTQARPSDIIPESGHLRLGGAGSTATSRSGLIAVAGGESGVVTGTKWMAR